MAATPPAKVAPKTPPRLQIFLGVIALLLTSATPSLRAGTIDVTNPYNVLPGGGRTVNVSSAIGIGGLNNPNAIIDNLAIDNGTDGSFIFSNEAVNRLSISGFNGAFTTLRIFTASDPTRQPSQVIARSSTSVVTTLVATDYATLLGTFNFAGPPGTSIPLTAYPVPSPPPTSARGYFDLPLTQFAPAGTQSLYVQFTEPLSGIRVYELQALNIPEPTTLCLLATAAGLSLMHRRRI